MNTKLFLAKDRGNKNIGWLNSKFCFSFSDYHNPTLSAFGTLVAFNDDIVQAGKGFGTHPHSNMEIISIMLQGKMNHKDSMGYSTFVNETSVQIMSAGTGLYHEEYCVGDEDVNFLQIWILPKLQNISPRYQQRNFKKEDRKNKFQTVISNEEGVAHCWINQNAKIKIRHFEAGQQVNYNFENINKCVYIFVIKGTISIENETLNTRDAIGIWDTNLIEINLSNDSEILLIETVINQK
jgi:quercetin 2,3-dioxygenase